MTKFIKYWRFEPGSQNPDGIPDDTRESNGPRKGWYCWASGNRCPEEFSQWMIENLMNDNSCNYRFNNGNPIYQVFISDHQDAMLFRLKWSDNFQD